MSAFVRRETRDLAWEGVYGSGAINFLGGGRTKALRLASVYAAVSLIADMFSSLPQHFHERAGAARRPIPTPEWLANPAPGLSPFDWRYQYTTSLELRGNAYGYVVGDLSRPSGMVWLHPDTVSPVPTATGPEYHLPSSVERPWSQGGRIVHVRKFIEPGSIKGLSPIRNFARDFDLGYFASEFGRKYFEEGATPTSLLTSKSRLKPGQAAEAKKLFREAVADGGPVTLDQEWDYKKLSVDPAEAQFLATIKANATTIGTIFRVPPEDIGGEAGSSRTYGNREADAERFNVRTMLPHVTRYETAINELLGGGKFVRLSMDVLARPNLIDRVRANAEALRTGQLFHDEMRALEDRAPATPEQIAFWQENYQTVKSMAESITESVSESITKEA